jgi:L-threonylcarbamoyladenylate synthase
MMSHDTIEAMIMQESVKKAAEIIRNGGIVIYPTDTAFGIGCRIDNAKAVEKLFEVRRRPLTKATPVLAASLEMLEPYIQPINDEVINKLIKPFWPGGLTIVIKCNQDAVPPLVRKEDTLGVRVPNHLTTLELINMVGVPIIGTSANFPGDPTPYHFGDLDPELIALVDYVVPGETFTKEASTVIDVTQNPWKILRQGAVTIQI